MGVISAKHEMIANRMDVKPSHMLLAICKRLFLGLQIQLPRLFGEPTNMVSGWSMNQVLKVIHLLFVSSKSAKTKKVNAISKKKEEAPAAEEEAEIDEVSIYDCIAGFVLAAY